jgi:hypothetical protein
VPNTSARLPSSASESRDGRSPRAFVGGTLIAETTAQIGGSMQVRTSIAATPATVGGRPGHDESWPLPGRHLRRVETAAGEKSNPTSNRPPSRNRLSTKRCSFDSEGRNFGESHPPESNRRPTDYERRRAYSAATVQGRETIEIPSYWRISGSPTPSRNITSNPSFEGRKVKPFDLGSGLLAKPQYSSKCSRTIIFSMVW